MPFENVPDVFLLLNPSEGNHLIVLRFPAKAVQQEYDRLHVMLPELDDAHVVDHVYANLQTQVVDAMILHSNMGEDDCVYEKNMFYANGDKMIENGCPFNLIPVAELRIGKIYYQISLVPNLRQVSLDAKVYNVPISEQWDDWSLHEQDTYWYAMMSQLIYVHKDWYESDEGYTSVEMEMERILTDNETDLV